MFHYQVGSLEDEPFVIARRLAARGQKRVALVREDSFIGRQYASFFDDAVLVSELELLGTVDLDVSGDNGADVVAGLDALAPDAVVYFGLGMSTRGLSVAMRDRPWPVITNSALMFGHMYPEWTARLRGLDLRGRVRRRQRRAGAAARTGCRSRSTSPGRCRSTTWAAWWRSASRHAPSPTRQGMHDGLERVKQVPSALGEPGTVMGFGRWKRSALEGGYLVLRQWRDGTSVKATV